MDMAFNAAAMERVRADNERMMNAQMNEMRDSKAMLELSANTLDSEAAELDNQAAAQELVAATAMKTVCTGSGKDRVCMDVPDVAARAAAAAKAASLRAQSAEKRAQSAALRSHAAALGVEVGKLSQTLVESNAFMRKLIDLVQQTDLSYAQMMEHVIAATQDYTNRMQAVYDSIGDIPGFSGGSVNGVNANFNPLTGAGAVISASTVREMEEQERLVIQAIERSGMLETIQARRNLYPFVASMGQVLRVQNNGITIIRYDIPLFAGSSSSTRIDIYVRTAPPENFVTSNFMGNSLGFTGDVLPRIPDNFAYITPDSGVKLGLVGLAMSAVGYFVSSSNARENNYYHEQVGLSEQNKNGEISVTVFAQATMISPRPSWMPDGPPIRLSTTEDFRPW